MKCPFCGKEMLQGKICSSGALWWKQEGQENRRLNDESSFLGRLNGDRITAYQCDTCKKIVIDTSEHQISAR